MKPVSTTGRWRVPWIEALPDGWQFLSAKRLFQARPELAPIDAPQLAATQAYGVIEQAEYERRVGRKVTKLNKNLDKRRLVKRDDFIISMRSFEGGLERAWAEGGIRSSYIVLKPSAELRVGYYQHLFKSQPYIQALRATGNFIRDGQDLNYSNFSLVDLPYPPLEDQELIARYLDWHGAMTGKLIRAKRRLIALLNEQKQSIIHRAVTRGLDPAAKLKPSGVDWLGDVPEHWEVKPLKHVVTRIVGGSTPKSGEPEYWDGDVIWVTPSDISQTERLNTSIRKITDAGLASCGASMVPAGSVIVTSRAPVGNVAIAQVTLSTNQGCKSLVPDPNQVETDFAFHVLKVLKAELVSLATGTTFAEISSSKLGSVRVPLPPLKEQCDILTAVDLSTTELNNAIEAAQAEISFIQEFRTRLIADVVTGQLDVRTVAANLPDVAEVDAADLTDDDDLDDDAVDLIDEEEAA